MKKGSIGATILSLVLVLLFISCIAVIGVLWWRQNGHALPQNISKLVRSSDQDTSAGSLSVIAPADGSVFEAQKNNIQVSGIAKPNSVVAISTSKTDKLLQSDEAGNFQNNIDLDTGVNFIKVTNINGADKFEKTIAVFLSDQAEASSSGSSLGVVADKKVFWGKVKGILKNNLTLSAGDKTREVTTSGSTKFEFPDRKSDPDTDSLPSIQKIIVDNIVIALGSSKDDTMSASSLIVYKNSPLPSSNISYGTISTVDTDDESIIFTEVKGAKTKVFWNSNSVLSGKVATSFAKISTGNQIFLTFTKNKLGNLIINEAIVATPSASTASSSAKKS